MVHRRADGKLTAEMPVYYFAENAVSSRASVARACASGEAQRVNRRRQPGPSAACPQVNRLFRRFTVQEEIWEPIFGAAGLAFVVPHLIRPMRSPFCVWWTLRGYPTSFSKVTHDGGHCKVIHARGGLRNLKPKASAFLWKRSFRVACFVVQPDAEDRVSIGAHSHANLSLSEDGLTVTARAIQGRVNNWMTMSVRAFRHDLIDILAMFYFEIAIEASFARLCFGAHCVLPAVLVAI